MSDVKSVELDYNERIGTGGPDSILASYFKEILYNLKMDFDGFLRTIDRFIVSICGIVQINELSTARSALRRELMNMTMTWKVFMKGLVILRIKHVHMEIILHKEDHDVSIHHFDFDISNINVLTDSEDDVNTLSLFYRRIIDDLEITKDRMKDLLQDYVIKARPGAEPEMLLTHRSAIKREVLKDYISWKNFIKGLMILKTQRMVLTSVFTYHSGRMTRHTKSFVFK